MVPSPGDEQCLPCLLLWASILIIFLTQCALPVSFMVLVYLILTVKNNNLIIIIFTKKVHLLLC